MTTEPLLQKPLRLWPGVIIVLLLLLVRFVIPVIIPDAIAFALFGGVILGLKKI